ASFSVSSVSAFTLSARISASVATFSGRLRLSITATNCAAAPATRRRRVRSDMSRSISLLSMKVVVSCIAVVMEAPGRESSILPARPAGRPGEREVGEEVLRLHAQAAVGGAREPEVDRPPRRFRKGVRRIVELEAEKEREALQVRRVDGLAQIQ